MEVVWSLPICRLPVHVLQRAVRLQSDNHHSPPALLHPLPFRIKDMEFGGAVCVMVITWLMVIFLSAFPLTGLDYFGNFYGRSGVCLALHITPMHHSGWEYSVLIFLVLNFVSFATIAMSYTVMFVVARKTQRAVNRSRDAKTGDAMARRMTLIVMTDFVCWIPIILLGVASLGGAYIPSQVNEKYYKHFVLIEPHFEPHIVTVFTKGQWTTQHRALKHTYILNVPCHIQDANYPINLVPCVK